MRIVVTGATGNVGTSLLASLGGEQAVEEVVGLARRVPALRLPKVVWRSADVRDSGLTELFRGADAVVHLAWLIQPARRHEELHSVNVDGSARVFRAVAEAGVPSLVYASSIGAYGKGPKDRPVDESWPTDGTPTSFYGRHKAKVERLLDRFEAEHPAVRVVRLRKALVFKREAASGVARLFIGSRLPLPLLRPSLIPVVPATSGLVFQAVHSLDVGDAYRLALTGDARGPFNIAAPPVLDGPRLGELLAARPVPVPRSALRLAADLSFRARLQPTEPGWVDMAFAVPVMDTTRATRELGWQPRFTAGEALLELLDGMRQRLGIATPPLSPLGGPLVEPRLPSADQDWVASGPSSGDSTST